MLKKTSMLTTIGGILGAFGLSIAGTPLIVLQYYAQIAKAGPPQWFNDMILPLMLIGVLMAALGSALTGVAAKGADDHSTIPQMEAATVKATVEDIAAKVEVKPSEMPAVPVVIVNPKEKQ